MSMGLLDDKVCLITGAGRGIGKEIASLFALEGAIVYAADIQRDLLEEWIESFTYKSNLKVIPIFLDVTDSTAVKNTIVLIKQQQGKLDVLVNNAAIITYELLGMISKETMRKMFEVNVFAAIELMQYSSRLMERNKCGSIINIASIVGVKGAAGQLSYAASKELASKNIRVNAIAPGMIGTDRFTAVMNEHFSERTANIRMGRLGTSVDVAKSCLFFASDQSEYITGQILGVEGCLVI